MKSGSVLGDQQPKDIVRKWMPLRLKNHLTALITYWLTVEIVHTHTHHIHTLYAPPHPHFLYHHMCTLIPPYCYISPHCTFYTHTLTEVSTRMVSEYKTKLQISEAERSRLEGMVCVCVCVCVCTCIDVVCVCVWLREGGWSGLGPLLQHCHVYVSICLTLSHGSVLALHALCTHTHTHT